MRLAESHGVAREDFLKNYQGSELAPGEEGDGGGEFAPGAPSRRNTPIAACSSSTRRPPGAAAGERSHVANDFSYLRCSLALVSNACPINVYGQQWTCSRSSRHLKLVRCREAADCRRGSPWCPCIQKRTRESASLLVSRCGNPGGSRRHTTTNRGLSQFQRLGRDAGPRIIASRRSSSTHLHRPWCAKRKLSPRR
jgi:hypothetical protein